jgi:hypothetical protein
VRDDSEADPDGEGIGEVEDVNGSWTSRDAAVEEA